MGANGYGSPTVNADNNRDDVLPDQHIDYAAAAKDKRA
jgi:hypothetical protein